MAEAATFPGAAVGYNCRLSVRGYGSRVLMCTRLSYGVEVSARDDEAARSRSLYPMYRASPSFVVSAVFASWSLREAFNAWATEYMARATAARGTSGYAYVEVPDRRFARYGVLVGPLVYGASVGDLAYHVDLGFEGAQDPVPGVGVSYYRPASKDLADAPYFYPSGTQRAGAESLEGTFYDPTPAGAVPDVTEVPPYEQPARPGRDVPR
jgi:hypothetical protein